MAASFFEALELLDWARASFAGWRYLMSGSFRRDTHERWKHERAGRVVWDVVCGAAGIAASVLLLYVLISLFAGWDWVEQLIVAQ